MLELVGVVEGAVEDIFVVRVPCLRVVRLLGERGDEVVVDAGGEHAGGRCAVLTCVEEACDGDRLGRLIQVGVVEVMTGALPPSSRWTRLRSSAAAFATSMPAGRSR